jgi:uncharacterized repeat protein (TIGR03803 family)
MSRVNLLKVLLLCILQLVMHGIAVAQTAALTTLVDFNDTNGASPQWALVQGPDGSFYGTTFFGGTNNYGTVFKVTTGGTLATLVYFCVTNGEWPAASLTPGSGGNFYGMTSSGGSNESGTVFQMTTNGILYTLYPFSASVNGTNVEGASPQAGLTLGSDGLLYGTTCDGGGGGDGTVFKITTNGTLAVLHSFRADALNATYAYTNADGANPKANLAAGNDGKFYGTTSVGGTNGYGTVFQVTTNGTFTTLVAFNGTNGSDPLGQLTLGTDGNFYGTTSVGGTNNNGTVFEMATNGTMHVIHTFSETINNAGYTNVDGASPQAGLTPGNNGIFYGTTTKGGNYGYGTVFQMTTNGMLTTLASFANTNGASPVAELTFGNDGNLYGTANTGGATGNGTVFKLSIAPVQLSIQLIPGKVVLSWTAPSFSLQSAPEAVGGYTNISGATSPYTNPIVNVHQFFRLIGN